MEHLLRLTKRALRRHMQILAVSVTTLILALNTYAGLRPSVIGLTISREFQPGGTYETPTDIKRPMSHTMTSSTREGPWTESWDTRSVDL